MPEGVTADEFLSLFFIWVVLSTQPILTVDEMIDEIVEEEVAVDEDTDDNGHLEEENEITKPRASAIRDAIDILAN